MDPHPQVTPFTRLNVAVWRDLGDLIGLHGLQKLWWTGSRAIQGTMKRVLFRSLRGMLYKESVYKSMGSTPSDVLPTQSMCLELQAQEVVVAPWPNDPSRLKLRRLSQYYLASFLVTSRSIRASIPLDIPVSRLLQVAWLSGWQKTGQLTLVAGDFDSAVLGSHAAPLRLTLEVCEGYEMSALQDSTVWLFVGCARLVSLDLSLTIYQTLELPPLQKALSLTSFTLRLMHMTKKGSMMGTAIGPAPTVKLALGPNLSHVAIHNDIASTVDIIAIVLEGERQQLQSLELSKFSFPQSLNEVSGSIQSLKLIKCYIYEAWTVRWPIALRHLVLEDCFSRVDVGLISLSQRRIFVNPLNLPRNLETLKITSSTPLDYKGPDSSVTTEWLSIDPSPIPPLAGSLNPLDGTLLRLCITEHTLLGSTMPCTNLKRLQLDSSQLVSSLQLLPESLVSLHFQRSYKGKLVYEDSLFSNDDHYALMRGLSSRSAMLNSLEPYASTSHILPNLISVNLDTAIWNYYVPLHATSGDIEVDKKNLLATRPINITHWLLRSIGDLLYVRDDIKDEGVGTRAHARRLAGQWRIWKVARHWTASLPPLPGVTEFCAYLSKPSAQSLKTGFKLAEASTGQRAIWDSSDSFYGEIFKNWKSNPFEWKSMPSHLERIEIRGVTQEALPHFNFRVFPSLRFLLLAAQTSFPFNGAAKDIFTPSLVELILLFEFDDNTFPRISDVADSLTELKRLVISHSSSIKTYRSLRLKIPSIESLEIAPSPFQGNIDRAAQVAAWRRYMENLALMQAEARMEELYEPSAVLCQHFAQAPILPNKERVQSKHCFALGMPNLTEDQRAEVDASVRFDGAEWPPSDASGPSSSSRAKNSKDASTSTEAARSSSKVITLETISNFLETRASSLCHFNRFTLSHHFKNWKLPIGLQKLDLSVNAAEALEGWSEDAQSSVPLKYSYFESHLASPVDDLAFAIPIDQLPRAWTLTHLTLTTIYPEIRLFLALPTTLRKLHVFNQSICEAPRFGDKDAFPPNIEDIYAPGLIFMQTINHPGMTCPFPRSLTRLVCSSVAHTFGPIPSHFKMLVVNGQVLRSLSITPDLKLSSSS